MLLATRRILEKVSAFFVFKTFSRIVIARSSLLRRGNRKDSMTRQTVFAIAALRSQ
jgi:hypothetical protein